MLDNYVDPLTCKDKKLNKGLPSIDEVRKHMDENNSCNFFFMYGDGSGAENIWAAIYKGELVWYSSCKRPAKITDWLVGFMNTVGYSWPVDKYGNKI